MARDLINFSFLQPALCVEVDIPLPLLSDKCGDPGHTCDMCISRCAQTRQVAPQEKYEFAVPSGAIPLKEEETCPCGEWKPAEWNYCNQCNPNI